MNLLRVDGKFSWFSVLRVPGVSSAAELIIMLIEVERPYRLFVKPAAVFATAFLSLGLQSALVVAGIDLLINLTHKIKRKKKKRKKKKKK